MSTQLVTTEGWVDYVYRIWDRQNELFWTSPRGKRIWNRPGDAKNAWNMANSVRPRCARPMPDVTRFNEQTRFVVRKFRLTFVEEV